MILSIAVNSCLTMMVCCFPRLPWRWVSFLFPCGLCCCIGRPKSIDVPSRLFYDFYLGGPVGTRLDGLDILWWLLGYSPSNDAWWCEYLDGQLRRIVLAAYARFTRCHIVASNIITFLAEKPWRLWELIEASNRLIGIRDKGANKVASNEYSTTSA